MANRLKMAKIDAVLRLHQQHWSIRRIAKELGISRKAVVRHIRLGQAIVKGCQAPIGICDTWAEAKEATPLVGISNHGRNTVRCWHGSTSIISLCPMKSARPSWKIGSNE
jgi:hypothetical protein